MIVALLVSCQTELPTQDKVPYEPVVEPSEDTNPSEPSGSPTTEPEEELPSVSEDNLGDVDLDSSEAQSIGRNIKRMTVYQIRDAMIRVSGGIQWGGNNSDWDEYADILGVPDYQNVVDQDLSPSLMFQKFLDDAALYTCSIWLDAELQGNSQLFFVQPHDAIDRASVMENIVHLRWQIQGKSKASEDDILDDYEQLFYTVHQRSESSVESWLTVCTAMFTHPDFFYY